MSGSPSPLRRISIGLLVLATGLALAGCDAVVEVNATSNVSARYSSVLVTVKEVWFNKNAAAVPADADWEKFQLDEGRTIDLADITDGQLSRIADDMVVPSGTYRQMRIILASRDEELLDSADDVDATYNNQVTWIDDDGDEQTSPLEVLNSDQGIGIQMELKVVEAAVALGGSPDSASNRVQLKFDTARDLTRFGYGDQTGFLLNSLLEAFDARDVGVIRGTLDLSQLGIAPAGRRDIQVTAQRLDEDLDRRVVVASASVSRTGTFVLYPLPLEEGANTTGYDLVIHGPRIQTIIIRDVPVTESAPGDAPGITLGGIVVEPAESFEADVNEASAVFPPGARIGFYQTLPGEDEPYLIDMAALDPLQNGFAEPVKLSRAITLRYGTYSTGLSLQAGTPEEGASRYAVAALSPSYGHGAFADATLRPASPASETASFSVPAIGIPAAVMPGTISATVTVETPASYDKGVLLISREGGVVTVASLDEPLQQLLGSTFIDVTQVPAGTSSATWADGLYQLEAWTWNSADPADTFTRHPATEAVDLRATSTASGSVLIR